jgi:hypothetical protein
MKFTQSTEIQQDNAVTESDIQAAKARALRLIAEPFKPAPAIAYTVIRGGWTAIPRPLAIADLFLFPQQNPVFLTLVEAEVFCQRFNEAQEAEGILIIKDFANGLPTLEQYQHQQLAA